MAEWDPDAYDEPRTDKRVENKVAAHNWAVERIQRPPLWSRFITHLRCRMLMFYYRSD